MNSFYNVMAVGLTCVVGGCAAASHAPVQSQLASTQCAGLSATDRQVAELYAPGQVDRVEPLHRKEFLARAIQPEYVAGARLYLPAQQGWSQPYLERVLSCHAAERVDAHPGDPLRVEGMRSIAVSTLGSRFVVTIAGADRGAGKAIWQRASALRSDGQVEVRQLSEAPAPSRL